MRRLGATNYNRIRNRFLNSLPVYSTDGYIWDEPITHIHLGHASKGLAGLYFPLGPTPRGRRVTSHQDHTHSLHIERLTFLMGRAQRNYNVGQSPNARTT
ncbi:hypothetical protein Pmani_024233 [Petrolisthes manimaculis]|uniref:Uncharacterized protein n=1 Tax=Petrolisthes manimaculis TaxID=1843537 RepID=A0AAE1PAI2_9EUCA|nr:hypothetical protein Pmani_024233 [Petrolisthes manimaculis]